MHSNRESTSKAPRDGKEERMDGSMVAPMASPHSPNSHQEQSAKSNRDDKGRGSQKDAFKKGNDVHGRRRR